MATDVSSAYAALLAEVRAHAPAGHRAADLPLTISQSRAEALLHVVHDVGGQAGELLLDVF